MSTSRNIFLSCSATTKQKTKLRNAFFNFFFIAQSQQYKQQNDQHQFTLHHHHHHYQSFNREGRWGTTDDFSTSFLHFPLFSTALWNLPNSRPVHSLMLSYHLFLCLPCLLPTFTVPCKMVLGRPDKRETWPYHCSLRLFTIVTRSSCGPTACWILARTSLLVTWSLYEMCSLVRYHPISMACILLWSSAVRVQDTQVYRKMDVTRERISRILGFTKKSTGYRRQRNRLIHWLTHLHTYCSHLRRRLTDSNSHSLVSNCAQDSFTHSPTHRSLTCSLAHPRTRCRLWKMSAH